MRTVIGGGLKLPAPEVYVAENVVTFEWENIRFSMYDDEALKLARTIYDVLEVDESPNPEEYTPW